MEHLKQRHFLGVMVAGIFTALTFILNIRYPDYGDMDISSLNEFIHNICQSLSHNVMESTLIVIAIEYILYRIDKGTAMPKKKGIYVLSALISVLWVISISFGMLDDGLKVLYRSKGQMIKTVIYLIGYFNLFLNICKGFYTFLNSSFCNTINWNDGDLKFRCGVKTFWVIFFCWIPHLFLAYPATVITDAWRQLGQFFGQRVFTTHHTAFHTWLVGITMELGIKLKSGNFVLFMFICLQGIIFAAVISYGIITMKKLSSPRWLIYLSIAIAVISPYYTSYIGVVTKDTLYSYFFVLFVTELVYSDIMGLDYWKSGLHCILFVLAAMMVILFRNNGKYVIYPMLLVILGGGIKEGYIDLLAG